jgi:hemoglobin/transferrin/lactoferrin receptor protein
MRRPCLVALALLVMPSLPLPAQAPTSPRPDTLGGEVQTLEAIVVSATREPRRLLDIAGPASVLTQQDLQRRPHGSVISLINQIPGLELTGVGPNQLRPVIRGFGGQRILLLEDGLRVNNARRQQDFGELPALIPQQSLERVEVLRGPASVLYGSDAIGGVVNLVSAALPSLAAGDAVHGSARFRYVWGAAGTTQPSGTLTGRRGRLAFRLDGDVREAEAYEAPAGRFGTVTLDRPATVLGTGVRDRTLRGELGYDLTDRQQVFLRYSGYTAEDAGFGYVAPALIGPDAALVDIRYPEQRVQRGTVGYRGRDLSLPFADRVDLSVYGSSNERDLDQSIFAPFGPGTPPGAGIAIETRNFTDVNTLGARLEAGRALGGRQLLTYGVELARDRATGRDSSTTTVVGFGPPRPEISTRPALPTAEFRSLGIFAQDQVRLSDRLDAIVGVRYQANTAETFATTGLEEAPTSGTDRTAVWAANLLFRLTDDVRLIAASSRGFRSPNLVERFYNGVTPEGSGFQARNSDLRAETSTEFDLGVRVQRPSWSLDAFVFRNNLRDGVRIAATGDTVMGFPAFQNVNIDRLRVRGVEVSSTWSPVAGTTLTAGFSSIDQQDEERPLEPVGEGSGTKLVAGVRYRLPSGRGWAAVRLRHQAERETVFGEGSLIGATLPGFTVVDVDLGAIFLLIGPTANVVTATIENVGNHLYAETANASFFRPAPGRRLQVMWRTEF